MSENNEVNGRGVYMVVESPTSSFWTRVPNACNHLGKAFLTLAPMAYHGTGASSEDICATIQWAMDANKQILVSTGHYGHDESAGGAFHGVLSREDMEILTGMKVALHGYFIPNSPAGLLVYVALRHALEREAQYQEHRRFMHTASEQTVKLMAEAYELREAIRGAVGALAATKSWLRDSRIAKIRRDLEVAAVVKL